MLQGIKKEAADGINQLKWPLFYYYRPSNTLAQNWGFFVISWIETKENSTVLLSTNMHIRLYCDNTCFCRRLLTKNQRSDTVRRSRHSVLFKWHYHYWKICWHAFAKPHTMFPIMVDYGLQAWYNNYEFLNLPLHIVIKPLMHKAYISMQRNFKQL